MGSLLTLSTISPTLEESIDLQSPAAQAWLQLPKFPQINATDLAELEVSGNSLDATIVNSLAPGKFVKKKI